MPPHHTATDMTLLTPFFPTLPDCTFQFRAGRFPHLLPLVVSVGTYTADSHRHFPVVRPDHRSTGCDSPAHTYPGWLFCDRAVLTGERPPRSVLPGRLLPFTVFVVPQTLCDFHGTTTTPPLPLLRTLNDAFLPDPYWWSTRWTRDTETTTRGCGSALPDIPPLPTPKPLYRPPKTLPHPHLPPRDRVACVADLGCPEPHYAPHMRNRTVVLLFADCWDLDGLFPKTGGFTTPRPTPPPAHRTAAGATTGGFTQPLAI